MAIALDSEVAAAMQVAAAASGVVPATERGDAMTLRAVIDATLAIDHGKLPDSTSVSRSDVVVEGDDGVPIAARWYLPDDRVSTSAVVYAHGGGMISGSVDLYDPVIAHYAQLTGVAFLSVDYRLAPEVTGDTPVQDVYAALSWLVHEAEAFGVDHERIAIMGDSGGGGVAAGVAILARDNGIALAHQILIYPMLDSRTLVPDPHLTATATWTYDDNFTGWNALLPEGVTVSTLSSPSHLDDFADLAPTFIDVGDLDIFRDESIDYALRLLRAGVPCELHVRTGAPHAFEWIAPEAAVSRRSTEDRLRVIKAL
ncbi:alpha/beta hydrolase [Rhodococcoides fascians]|uniref:alpha/beta hydrolase n=1 Tax=Rhodococcoides fascians TaxID=1828 RepID=UPI0015C652B3|nr:alpha/beta hydrolase [Rhodococcus fascians]